MTKNIFDDRLDDKNSEEVFTTLKKISDSIDFRHPVSNLLYSHSIQRLLKNIVSFNQTLQRKDLIFNRARKHASPNTLFPNIKDLWYPPANVVGVGRANLPGEPIFYCATDPATTLYEVKPQLGDWITLVEIELVKDEINHGIFGVDTNDQKLYDELSEFNKGVSLFLRDIFTEKIIDQSSYYKTAWFVKGFIDNYDGLAYPSAATDFNGWNFVFTPAFIDSYSKFSKARVQEIVEMKSEEEFVVKCLFNCDSLDKHADFVWNRDESCNGHSIHYNLYH